jgi:non-lysosomal glucosylceramidase
VASHLIYEGCLLEGLAIVQGTRDRYTGVRRNPWNEIECGHHYARSMASYALLLALSDFRYSAVTQALHFAPRVYEDNFVCFFSVEGAWGLVRQALAGGERTAAVEVLYGTLTLRELSLGFAVAEATASLAGVALAAAVVVEAGQTRLRFEPEATIAPGATLEIRGAA